MSRMNRGNGQGGLLALQRGGRGLLDWAVDDLSRVPNTIPYALSMIPFWDASQALEARDWPQFGVEMGYEALGPLGDAAKYISLGALGIIGKKQQAINDASDFLQKHNAEITPGLLPTEGPDALANYGASLSNPAVRRRERLRVSDPNTVVEDVPMPDRKVIEPEGLLGRILVPNVGDPSRVGIFKKSYGVPLSEDVQIQAGPDYSRWMSGTGRGWASMLSAAQSKNNNLLAAMDLAGEAPLGVYTRMGDTSIDFSRPVAESMLNQIDAIKVPKKAQQQFSAEIRNLKINDKNLLLNSRALKQKKEGVNYLG